MLNRDAILKLSPDELNQEIWKAQGYRYSDVFSDSFFGKHIYRNPDIDPMKPIYTNARDLPDYAHSIAAAWELEQEIIDNDGLQCINQHEYADKLNIVLYHTCRRGYAAQDIDKQHATAEQRARAWLIWKQEAEK